MLEELTLEATGRAVEKIGDARLNSRNQPVDSGANGENQDISQDEDHSPRSLRNPLASPGNAPPTPDGDDAMPQANQEQGEYGE